MQSTWGQIKNIKLHIVTDIKKKSHKTRQKDERQVEEEKSAKVEEKKKKDERKIKVNNTSCHGDGTTTCNTMKPNNKRGNTVSVLSCCHPLWPSWSRCWWCEQLLN